jgi:hypothetical protein
MDSDPLCMPDGVATSELLLVDEQGGLQNVFVYVRKEWTVSTSPPPSR